MKNRTSLKTMGCALALLGAAVAAAQSVDEPWRVRGRAAPLSVSVSSSVHEAVGYGFASHNPTAPAVRVSYSFNKNAALALMLLLPQAHSLSAQDLGLVALEPAPSTLWLQYHFEAPGFRPYVGAGLNFTPLNAAKLPRFEWDKSSVSAALQVGVDVPMARNLFVNLELKKVYIGVDFYPASSNSPNLGAFKIDPLLFEVGLGLRF